MKDSGKKGLLGLGIGVAIGTVLTALFTPKTGKEMRGEIKTKAAEAKDKSVQTKDKVLVKAGELKEKASSTKEDAVAKAKKTKRSFLNKNDKEKK